MGNTIPHGDRLHECMPSCPEYEWAEGPDYHHMDENTAMHAKAAFFTHDDGRWCGFHQRLGVWVFDRSTLVDDKASFESYICLRDDHPNLIRPSNLIESLNEPTKQREGDQRLPDGRLDLVDDHQLLIEDIEARRQVGIERYGQGHRPFNGRDTMLDLYEEQLDLLVYFRSIRRMTEATQQELVTVISEVIKKNGFQQIVSDAMAEAILERMQGWLAAQIMKGEA